MVLKLATPYQVKRVKRNGQLLLCEAPNYYAHRHHLSISSSCYLCSYVFCGFRFQHKQLMKLEKFFFISKKNKKKPFLCSAFTRKNTFETNKQNITNQFVATSKNITNAFTGHPFAFIRRKKRTLSGNLR